MEICQTDRSVKGFCFVWFWVFLNGGVSDVDPKTPSVQELFRLQSDYILCHVVVERTGGRVWFQSVNQAGWVCQSWRFLFRHGKDKIFAISDF